MEEFVDYSSLRCCVVILERARLGAWSSFRAAPILWLAGFPVLGRGSSSSSFHGCLAGSPEERHHFGRRLVRERAGLSVSNFPYHFHRLILPTFIPCYLSGGKNAQRHSPEFDIHFVEPRNATSSSFH